MDCPVLGDTTVDIFFAMDHQKYAPWLPIHIRDMANVRSIHPGISTELEREHSTINKTNNPFSRIPTDQAHEQNNAYVKGEGGAIGIHKTQLL